MLLALQVILMNDFQKQRFVERVISAMFNTISKKKIAVFGFAFKKDTGDTRETPAIDVCRGLMADGANVRAGVLQRREKREPSRGASAVAQACSVGPVVWLCSIHPRLLLIWHAAVRVRP